MKKIFILYFLFVVFSGCEKKIFNEENYNTPENVFEVFWKEIDRHYSFFQYLDLDWDSVYYNYKPRVNKNTGNRELFDILSQMANLLKDGHVNLFSNMGVSVYTNWYSDYPQNVVSTNNYVENYKRYNNAVHSARIKNYNIGYIVVKTFKEETENYKVIDEIIADLKDTKGIIIDVRSNGGGNSMNADTIASRFAQNSVLAFRSRYRNGKGHNDFTEWTDVNVPVSRGFVYDKQVIVLTNRLSYSSTEWFVSEMRALPQVIIAGDTTGGGSGNPLVRQLPNGWVLRLSNSQAQLPEGFDYQYTGIYPDVPVWISENDANNGIDTILETAISIIEED